MKHRDAIRHLQLERLDYRIALNADAIPLHTTDATNDFSSGSAVVGNSANSNGSSAGKNATPAASNNARLNERELLAREGLYVFSAVRVNYQVEEGEGAEVPPVENGGHFSGSTNSTPRATGSSPVSNGSGANAGPVGLPPGSITPFPTIGQPVLNPTPINAGPASNASPSGPSSPARNEIGQHESPSSRLSLAAPLASASMTDRVFATPGTLPSSSASPTQASTGNFANGATESATRVANLTTNSASRIALSTKVSDDASLLASWIKNRTDVASQSGKRNDAPAVRERADVRFREEVVDTTHLRRNRLPTPNGMIDIVGTAEATSNSKRPVVQASVASVNPFEVLQWFVGSSNMMDTASSTPQTSSLVVTGQGEEAQEEPGFVTRDESLLVLATGVVVAITLRRKHHDAEENTSSRGSQAATPTRSVRNRPRPR